MCATAIVEDRTVRHRTHPYYAPKAALIAQLFGVPSVTIHHDLLIVGDRTFPIIDDVIILLDPDQIPTRLRGETPLQSSPDTISASVQQSFGAEWQSFPKILPEHKTEFDEYFDIVNLNSLRGKRICDLGCGMGRWSYFLRQIASELILVDFSEAIFVARKNLEEVPSAVFFMADLRRLPFRDDFAEFLFCLGVLHHLPDPCIGELLKIKHYAPQMLLYLYYAMDNRPFYFRMIWRCADLLRRVLARLKIEWMRRLVAWILTVLVYKPFVMLGSLLELFGLGKYIPLYQGYKGKSLRRICQDAYDRFFTAIEQRVRRKEVANLEKYFTRVRISSQQPYWHFLIER